MTRNERIAIARIVSDMIKADNIIEESEIELLNKFKDRFNLDNHILSEAHHIKFSSAISELENLSDESKIELFKNIQDMSLADSVCVPREALLLLAIRYAFGIEQGHNGNYVINHSNSVKIISCPTGESTISSQYAIYIEGKFNTDVNKSIQERLDVNVLTLRAWGFDFVYIPALIEEFRSMNTKYVKDVIRYMAPELADETIDTVYNRLLQMDTVKFCNYVLAEKLHVEEVKNSKPSLFINIGTSVVPYCSVSGPVECYTEFLCIPLDGDVTEQIKSFVKSYSKIVSFYSSPNPTLYNDKPNRFKYFGFYKAMFDFLVKAEPKTSDLVMYPWIQEYEFPQVSIENLKLSPQEDALYKLILECTYKHPLGGLPTNFAHYHKYQEEIKQMYRKIYHNERADFPDNLAPIRGHIESKMRKQLKGLANLEDFIPKLKDGLYVVTSGPDRIKISNSRKEKAIDFLNYRWK